MDFSKIIPTANKDIHLLLKTLKKVTIDVEIAAYNHLTSYAKNQKKNMKKIQKEDDFNLKNTQCGNSALKKSRFN